MLVVSIGLAAAGLALDRVARPWASLVRSRRPPEPLPSGRSWKDFAAAVAVVAIVSLWSGPTMLHEVAQLVVAALLALMGIGWLRRGVWVVRGR